MRVYRLTSSRFPRCDGEGARRYGGRWNSKGRAAVYTASTQSLAALEILVHAETLADDYVVLSLDIPSEFEIEMIEFETTIWDIEQTRARGDAWLSLGQVPVLQVPSQVVPAEPNYVINPLHSRFPEIVIGRPQPFQFDERLLSRLLKT